VRLQWIKFDIWDDHGEVRYSTANTSKGCKPHQIVRRRISSEKRIQDYLATHKKRLALSATQHTHPCLQVCGWIPRHFYTAFIGQDLPVVLNTAFRVRVQLLPSSSLVTQYFMKESNWSDTNKISKIQLTNSILKRHSLFSIFFSQLSWPGGSRLPCVPLFCTVARTYELHIHRVGQNCIWSSPCKTIPSPAKQCQQA